MCELVRRSDFYHPIQHPCSECAVDQMLAEEVLRLVLIVTLMQQFLSVQLTVSKGVILDLRPEFIPHWHGLVILLKVHRLGVVGYHSLLPLVAILQIVFFLIEGLAVSY